MGRTHLLVVAVLAILQPANAFLPWLRRQKQQQHHRLFRTLSSTDRSGRGSKIVLTSSLDALEDNKSEYNNNNNNNNSDSILKTETEWSQISSLAVETLNGDTVTLGDLMSNNSTVVLSCLSHFGDYNAWELTQQYMSAIQSGRLSEDCPVVLVGIGSVEAANTFAKDIGLSSEFKDRLTLVTDETGKVTEALDCYRGWLTIDKKHKERYPFTDVPPAVKLLGMIAGFGSPGTIEKVLQGYTGDVTKNYGLFGRQWVIQALQQGGDMGRFPKVDVSLDPQSDLKPFELATLRLQTGLHIVAKWGKLGPKDGDLITRMGGTFVFDKQQCVYEHFDQGILNFANMDDICLVTEAALKGERYVVPSNKAQAKKNRQELWARKDKESKMRLQEAAARAKEAQREAERLAREAKLAEEARLEELDRIEAERIAEVARQGEEAKQSRQAEMEAEAKAKAKEEKKLRTAEIEAEAKAKEDAERILEAAALEAKLIATKEDERAEAAAQEAEVLDKMESTSASLESDPVEDDFDVTVEEILRRAEEQEMKIRASLEAIQNIQKASAKDSQEKFQRRLLAARMQYEKDKQILPGIIINGASAPTGPTPEVPSKPTISSNLVKTSSSQQEAFQRKLLAAQFQYGEGSSNKPSTEESIENLHDQKDYEATEQQKAFQRELLAARIHYDKAAAGNSQSQVVISSVDSLPNLGTVAAKHGSKNGLNNGKDEEELFQRNLLATRLKYEVSNGKIRSTASTSTSKTTNPSIAQDQELL
ncbi:AhpC/TSA antioxidant enzyme [Nitzschia inconspicua]|uniref:AhpC/TSA antioxidant enzyme n=1 Tax=Nitzschia inconspicua TaxID=303405 RepID=A0A9K3L6J4_9STRA|nr:AhpC/TSA antioxidant enzyme [Nitzschia inconspicua]